jgi:hypothetical protein
MRGPVLTSKIAAAVVFGLMASSAFAAKSNANAGKSSSSTTSTAPAAATTTTTTTTTTATAPAEGSSTTSLPAAAAPAKPRPFKFTAYTRTDVRKANLSNRKGAVNSLNFLQAGYSVAEGKSVAVRQEFSYTFPKATTNGKATMRDTFVAFTDGKLAKFAGDGNVTGMMRVYLPTGETSRFITKQNGALMGLLVSSKPLGKFDVGYSVAGIYFNQSQNTYVSPAGQVSPNADFELDHWASVSYNFSPKLSLNQDIGTDNLWSRPGPNGVVRSHYLSLETTLSYQAMKQLSVSGSVGNSTNIFDSPNAFSLYRDDETTYRLALTASM